jgi:hypothetical protein
MTCPNCGIELNPNGQKWKTSQENRLFHKLVAILAMWKETSPDLMKRYVKMYSVSMHGYECATLTANGHTVIEPKSIARATDKEMRDILIPTCYELAMDWGCPMEQEEIK